MFIGTCGSIFDSKCTSVISGQRFGLQSTLRVCKTCLNILNARQGFSDSEESNDDRVLPTSIFQPYHKKIGASGSKSDQNTTQPDNDDSTTSDMNNPIPAETPMMAIPALRRTGDSANHRSAVLEIEPNHSLSRPSSSRSLKSLSSGRPQSSHRRYHSRHNFS